MEGTVTVVSGVWNQVQDDMEHSDMLWLVGDRTVTFDPVCIAWCVLTQFDCTEYQCPKVRKTFWLASW